MVGHSLGGALDAAPARDAAISAMPLATPGAKVALVDDVTRGVHEWQPITVTTADWTLLFSRWEDPVELYAAGSDEDVAGEHPEVVEALVELLLAELERGGASAADLEARGGRPRVVAAS
jgi:hypothetical protein